jgi:hypothetical protein
MIGSTDSVSCACFDIVGKFVATLGRFARPNVKVRCDSLSART